MNVESELKDIINRLYDIEDVSGPDLSKKIYEIILQCREAIGYRKAELDRVQSSRKPIKSFRDTSNEDTSNDYGFHWDNDSIYDKNGIHWYFGDYINDNTGIEPYSSYMQAVKETLDSIRDSFTEEEIPDPEDYTYQLIDYAVETLPDPGKFIKEYEGFVKSSRKPIKSSLEDRLVPYLEEFEEGYADALTSTDEMGNNARLETFYEMFKSDYNLSDDDINKLEGAVQDIWHETEEEITEHDMGEMYGLPHGATSEEALKYFE